MDTPIPKTEEKTVIPRYSGALYGSRFFHVIVPKRVSAKSHITFHADSVEVSPCGALIAHGGYRKHYGDTPEESMVVLSLAPGLWISVYAASRLDGIPVACDYWHEEVDRHDH